MKNQKSRDGLKMEKLDNFKDDEVKYAKFNKKKTIANAKKYSKLLEAVGRL